ncbi:MAG: hypothetical protein E6G94_05040 [Alphaproteobacteria bacterium]|nr:MAG: hypothetical protein E6G94_05040 [Alphaproteobacteria bacterium]
MLFGLLLALAPVGAAAQRQPVQAATSIPDQTGIARLVWSTMAAVDHANKTGNYMVLRSLGSPAFQAANSVSALATVFASVRQTDLSATLSVEPVYEFPPRLEAGQLRIRGAFRMRPEAVQFDLVYQWNQGSMLQAIAVRAVPASTLPPTR